MSRVSSDTNWDAIERSLGVNLLPWQREILDEVRAGRTRLVVRMRASGYHTMLRAAQLARVCDVIDALEHRLGVTGHVGTDARCIVVSESDYAAMREHARAAYWPRPVDIRTVEGVPVVTAPDWACDEVTVAWLRFRARAARPFRRLLRRLAQAAAADRNA